MESAIIEFSCLPKFLTKACADTTDDVVNQKLTLPHRLLDDASKHPKGKHIEKHVAPRSMEEHIGEELPDFEIRGKVEVKSEDFGQHIACALGNHLLHHKDDDVDEKQVSGNGRDILQHGDERAFSMKERGLSTSFLFKR